MDKQWEDILIVGLLSLNIEPSEDIVRCFDIYMSELLRWNRAYNLTSITDEYGIITRHFLDSLLYLHFMPQGRHTLCDVGSGAGFPGIPIALVRRDVVVTLVESSRKRCAFLHHIKKRLDIEGLEVIESPIEDVKQRQFDVIVTRALFSVNDMIKRTLDMLTKGGCIILSKGQNWQQEDVQLLPSIACDVWQCQIPDTDIKRFLLRFYRTT